MANVPTNMREFYLSAAKSGHPLVTRDGRPAKFIAHVPDVFDNHKLIVQIADEVVLYRENGWNGQSTWELFLAPLGCIDNKPVFAGDTLYNINTEKLGEIHASISKDVLEKSYKWPKQKLVVTTQMSKAEIEQAAFSTEIGKQWEGLCNAAIARSIADGDVIPTSVVEELMCKAYNEHYSDRNKSFAQKVEEVISEYLKGTK